MQGFRRRLTMLLAAGAVSAFASAAPPLVVPVSGGDADPDAVAVRFNAATLHALAPGAAVEFTLPNATRQALRFERLVSHGGGLVTWIASGELAGDSQRAVITTGPTGSWGWVQTPEGKYRLYPGEGHDWLAKPETSSRWAALLGGAGTDTLPGAFDDERALAGRKGVPTILDAALLPKASFSPKAAPVPQAQVDVMLVYTKDLALKLGGSLMPMLHNLVTSTNLAFSSSEVAITLRLVRAEMVDYPNANGLLATLRALAGDATSPSSPALAAQFAGVRTLRDAVGADLVALLRDGPTDGGGIAFLLANPTPGVVTQTNAYSVIQYCASGCEETFAHEIAHNMGSGHDRATEAFDGGGTVPASSGVYAYSFGHYDCANSLTCNPFSPGNDCGATRPQCASRTANDFGTIMSFIEPTAFKYSNPALLCVPPGGSQPGRACGAAGTADNALSLNNVRSNVSAYRNQAIATLPGSLQFTATGVAVPESAGGVTFTVSRLGGSSGAVSVQYAVTAGTATAGPDFTAASGTLSWANGDAADKTLTVPVSADAIAEGVEAFKATLSNPAGATGVYLGWPVESTALLLEPAATGPALPAGFTSPSANPWTVATDLALAGEGASFKSGAIAFGTNACDAAGNPGTTFPCPSTLTRTVTLAAGQVSFAYRVSAYPAYGFLEFFVDGVLVLQATGAPTEPAADTGWRYFSTPVAAGSRTLTWRYRSALGFACALAVPFGGTVAPYPSCADRAWVAGLALPTPKAPVTLEVGANGNPAIPVGGSVSLYGTLSAPVQSVAGTVTFKDNGVPIPGCIGLDVSQTTTFPSVFSSVSCSYTGAVAGSRAITMEFGGDANVAAGASAPFAVTVVTIDPFPLTTSEPVAFGALATSDPVTLTGFTGTLPISIVGGRYSKNCTGVYTTAPGTVQAGDTVCVRVVTPRFEESPYADLSVGGVISTFAPYPSRSNGDVQPANVAAGIGHTLAAPSGGTVYGWGDATGEKLGGVRGGTSIPVDTGRYGFAVAAGLEHSLSVSTAFFSTGSVGGQVRSMGLNGEKQLGIPPGYEYTCSVPGPEGGNFPCSAYGSVQGLDRVVAIGAGWRHSIALKSDGTVWAWGSGQWGQNGAPLKPDTTPDHRDTPTLIPIAGTVVRIAAGYMHNLALLSDGTVVAWGHGAFGELGPATLAEVVPTPVAVTGLTNVVDIAAGGGYSLALLGDGTVVSWGLNVYGTLGDPNASVRSGTTPSFRAAPTAIPGLASVIQIAAGFGTAYARTSGGPVLAWGLNHRGQAGNALAGSVSCGTSGTHRCLRSPATVPGTSGVVDLYAGGAHFVGRRGDESLVQIGDNSAGQLGNSGGNFRDPPFDRTAYDPDTVLNPAGASGTPFSVGKSGTSGAIDLDQLGAGVDLGSARVGLDTNTADLTLTNVGDAAIQFNAIAAEGYDTPAEFSSTNNCPSSLAAPTQTTPGGTCTITLSFAPGSLYGRSGRLVIDTTRGSMTLELTGTGLDPKAPSATALASPNGTSAVQGTAMSFLATVTSSAPLSGSVEFASRPFGAAVGLTPIAGCAAVPVNPANGQASCTPSPPLAAGTLEMMAFYSGSATVQASNSSFLYFTVDPAPVMLTVTRSGAGGGTVSSSPAGIACGATCSANFNSGSTVTLTATPDAGSAFGGWSGGGCSGTGTCQVTLSAATTVTATFVPAPFTLTVVRTGPGTGTVASSPAGITCGATCSASFVTGTVVTLTATPAAGSTFAGWSGGGCSGTGTCQVTLNAAATVTASFVPDVKALTVTRSGTGTGRVASVPAGIDCGAACAASFATGASVELKATPAAGSYFMGWSGDCTGTGPCTVAMNAARGVTAAFTTDAELAPRLGNIATRMEVATGDNVLIGGFVIGGSAPKKVVVRASGPSLARQGVSGFLPNPTLQLLQGQRILGENDDWSASPDADWIRTSNYRPGEERDSVIVQTLAPGAYTAIVRSASGQPGVALIEVFEVDAPATPLINIATRGQVLDGDKVMIGGFIISGAAPQSVVVRVRAPSLTSAGLPAADLLADPVLEIISGGVLLATSDDWKLAADGSPSPDLARLDGSGFSPTNDKEAAVILTLPPGGYTAIVRGKNGGTGIAIIEVFAL